jgi:tetratricopeptide (TPR) repeat protein
MALEFTGTSVAIIGLPERVPIARLVRELERRGALPHRRVVAECRIAVVAHGAAAQLADDRLEGIVARAARSAEILSEHQILRAVDLLAPVPAILRPYGLDQLLEISGLARRDHLWLELFDVFEPEGGRYSFADLSLARQIQGLLRSGIAIAEIVSAAIVLRRRAERTLGPVGRLVRTAGGGLGMQIGDVLSNLEGQTRLPLAENEASLPGTFAERAAEAEAAEDWATAERLYQRCAQIDPTDAVAHFNLATVVWKQGRTAEAAALLQIAADLDPLLAEAWYNLAHIAEDKGDIDGALRHLEMAIACDQHYMDAVFNLAMLHLKRRRLDLALTLFERYATQDPDSAWGQAARTAAAMCRMELQSGAPGQAH